MRKSIQLVSRWNRLILSAQQEAAEEEWCGETGAFRED